MRRRVCVTVAAAALMALAAGCAVPRRDEAVRIDPALAALTPSDATLLVGVRVESLKDTYLWKKYFDRQDLPGVTEFIKVAGLDPRQDIYETLFAGDGKHSVIMARGKFSPDGGLEPRLNFPNAKRIPYKTYTLVGSDQMAVTFMNPSVAVAAPVPYLKSVIDGRGSGAGISKAMLDAVGRIPAANQIWAVSSIGFRDLAPPDGGGSAAAGRTGTPPPPQLVNLGQFLRLVESYQMQANLSHGLNVRISAKCPQDTDARHLNDALRGLIGMGRLQTPDNRPDLLRVYDAIQVSYDGRVVTLVANLDSDQLEKLGAELERLQRRAPAPNR